MKCMHHAPGIAECFATLVIVNLEFDRRFVESNESKRSHLLSDDTAAKVRDIDV